ncbi:MAG: HlyD family efflux transporter periplasmic adaptor subunit [Patescibacteria group bacterium]|nr:HlyD family efflux transporter periplasmic adaptor subunit [Patescibacteria group bacterium]
MKRVLLKIYSKMYSYEARLISAGISHSLTVMFQKIKKFVKGHKLLSLIIAVLFAITVYWRSTATSGSTAPRYLISEATTGTVVASVTGSGQVQNTSQININPQVTETVTGVYVQPGDKVNTGQLLVQLDATNELRALRQAQLSLQSAQLALEKMQEVTTSTLIQDQSAVVQAQQNLADASTTVNTDYQNGFDTLASAFVDMQAIMADANSFVNGYAITKSQQNPQEYVNLMPSYLQTETQPYANKVVAAYDSALAAYQANLADFHNDSRNSNQAALDSLFSETYSTSQFVSASIKSINDLLNFVVNNYPTDSQQTPLPPVTATFQTTFGSDIKTVNNDVSNVLGVINGISTDKNNLENDQLSLAEASSTLAELVAGPTPVDIQTQEIAIETAQNNLQTAEENLADCSIRAPIAGIVSTVPSTVGATVPTPAVSMVGGQKIAEVTLNEVDAAKVNLGDKATLTFDAINGLSLAGTVIEVDPVGTVSQGVVNYNVQISLSGAPGADQIKPGMSVTADIVTGVHQNVITIPSSAIVTSNGTSYVLEPQSPVSSSTSDVSGTQGVELNSAPKQVPVVIGLTNNTLAEIISGVKAGDQIITQTIQGSSVPSVSGLGGGGAMRGGTGGGGRFLLGG